jgi:hypothetical protein
MTWVIVDQELASTYPVIEVFFFINKMGLRNKRVRDA